MPISEVHACWPPKYVYGLLDLSVNVEVKGTFLSDFDLGLRSDCQVWINAPDPPVAACL